MRISINNFIWVGLTAVLLFLGGGSAWAQTHRVSGTVLDSSGEPIIGAVVMVEGTNNAATTDIDGAYSLTASDSQTLVFNCLGYKDAREVVGSRTVINVTLEDDVTVLDQAVAIGYSTIKKRDLT